MRVLHVLPSAVPRGSQMFAADLVQALENCGIEQGVAVLRAEEGSVVSFDAPTEVLGSRHSGSPGFDLRTHIRLRRAVRAFRPDVVQAHGGEALKHCLAATLGRAQTIVYRRIGGAPAWIRQGARRLAYAGLMRRAARVVTVAESVRRETIDLFGLAPDRVVTIPNGVSVERLEPTRGRRLVRRDLGIEPGAPVMLSLGALIWEKDPLGHLALALDVLRRRSEAIYLVAGDGPLRGALDMAIPAGEIRGRVRLLGRRRDVGDLLAASDVLLFASRADGMEGMPGSIIEAGAAGLPVAAYRVAGVPEVVLDGETGIIADWGDRERLADGIVELLRDEDLRREMGTAARKRCRRLFDIRAVAPRYQELYQETRQSAVEARGRPRPETAAGGGG